MADSKPGLKIIGAGAARTGTSSLQKAIEILGFGPCYHMKDVIKNNHAPKWINVLTGTPTLEDWEDIFGDRTAVLDFPASVAYKELLEAYPDAKVVLSVRDSAGWAKSVNQTIWSPQAGELSNMQAPWRFSFQRMARVVRKRFFNDGFGGFNRFGKRPSDEKLMAAFEEWNKEVVASLPKDKVLVFQMKDGWEPLCKFLGVPVPNEPFPHVNDAEAFKNFAMARWKEARNKNIKVLGGVLAAGLAVGLGAMRILA